MRSSPMLVVALLVATMAGCKGAEGATGPVGPPGPPGPPGSVNRADLRGAFSASGSATLILPLSAVAGNTVPVISCYISDDNQTWLAVAQTPPASTDPFCGLTGIGTASPGVTIVNGPTGFFYYLVAAW